MKKRIVFLILLVFVLAIFLGGFFLKQVAQAYVSKLLSAECTIGSFSFGLSGIRIEDVKVRGEGFDGKAQRLHLHFEFQKFWPPQLSRIDLDDWYLTISALEDTVRRLQNTFSSEESVKSEQSRVIYVDINNASFHLDDPHLPEVNIGFSFAGTIKDGALEVIDALSVRDFTFKTENVMVEQTEIKKNHQGTYELAIAKVVFKGEEIRDVRIPFRIIDKTIIFEKSPQNFFGTSAYLEGTLAVSGDNAPSLHLEVTDASFINLGRLLGAEDSVVVEGLFEGIVDVSCVPPEPLSIRARFHNPQSGLVNIKKETSLEFLRERLDEASYNALIDNFRNYRYNRGTIALSAQEHDLIVQMDFDSQELGKRSITVNFHDLLGGGE